MDYFALLPLRSIRNEFLRLPLAVQDEILSKYRIPRIELALSFELEELQQLSYDVDRASCEAGLVACTED